MLPNLNYWLHYFESNAKAPSRLNWAAVEGLTDDERDCVQNSIATFQLGESSEGHGLTKFANAYASNTGDKQLISITRLFIAQEQHHAAMLKRFMANNDISLKSTAWTDTVFRQLRRHVGYELSISVLIVAELISLSYYQALRDATENLTLKQICDSILRDEARHVEFESAMVRSIRADHGSLRRGITELCHRVLFGAAVGVVWFDHRRVLRRGGYVATGFWAQCWADYHQYFGVRRARELAA